MFLLLWLLLVAVPLVWLGSFVVVCLMGLAELSERFHDKEEVSDSDAQFLRSCGIRSAAGGAASVEETEPCEDLYSRR